MRKMRSIKSGLAFISLASLLSVASFAGCSSDSDGGSSDPDAAAPSHGASCDAIACGGTSKPVCCKFSYNPVSYLCTPNAQTCSVYGGQVAD